MRGPLKELAKKIYANLPFPLQVALARNNPEAAFYISKKPRERLVDYYLGKYTVHVDTRWDIERRMLSGSYESETMAIIGKFVKLGDTCLDVGANVGAIAIALADAVGETGRVEAFEPGQVFCERLRRNIALNPGLEKRIGLHPVGLSNKRDVLRWQESSVSPGTASTYAGALDPNREIVEVPVVRLDDYAPVQALARIDFLKIDVDGLELPILEGATATIARCRPTLYVEVNTWNEEMRESARGIETLLNGIDYKIFKISGKDYRLEPAKFPDFSFNIVAVPASRGMFAR